MYGKQDIESQEMLEKMSDFAMNASFVGLLVPLLPKLGPYGYAAMAGPIVLSTLHYTFFMNQFSSSKEKV